ncbi:MAG: fibronectin type III domain-containing protein [Chlorobi bacterium CHB2]|nr:fibronectin type III domain-containing protein [Chlorobi bacterium CHB2]
MKNLKQTLLAAGLLAAGIIAGCSDDDTATNPTTVDPVTNLRATTVTDKSVALAWDYAAAADSFRIWRNGTQLASVVGTTKTYTDNGLTASTLYTYSIVAVKGGTASASASFGISTTLPGSTEKRAILAGNTGDKDRMLSKDTIYTIVGFYFVQPGTKLIIPAGTRLEGDFETKGAIITVRGTKSRSSGQLIAQGTPTEPIIFTSEKPEGQRARGDWGGIVLNGLADINVPGKTGTGEGGTGTYGPGGVGTAKNDDTSGVLTYVRIEYGGTKITADNEVNGLTLNGVGSGTVLDHVQVHFIADDGFEWFGGTVNGRYLVSSGNDDDMFDMDFGYSGKLQFLFGIQDPDLANRGFEVDNDADGSTNEPFTSATIANVTLIGAGKEKANNENNDGLYLRRNNKLKIYNAIVTNFRYGLVVDGSTTKDNADNGELFVKNSILHGSAGAYTYAKGTSADLDPIAQKNSWNIATTDPALTALTFTAPNPLPTNFATLPQAAQLPSEFFQQVSYIGAFGPATNWIQGWTAFKKN